MKCKKCGNEKDFFFYTIICYEADLSCDEFIKTDETWHHASCSKCGEKVELTEADADKFWRNT